MKTKTIVTSIPEAVSEIQKQLGQQDFYIHNYRLLESIKEYLDKCIDKDDEDFNQGEQIYNHLAYDLKWEQNEKDLFPMEL